MPREKGVKLWLSMYRRRRRGSQMNNTCRLALQLSFLHHRAASTFHDPRAVHGGGRRLHWTKPLLFGQQSTQEA
jgi:hypothetical protein